MQAQAAKASRHFGLAVLVGCFNALSSTGSSGCRTASTLIKPAAVFGQYCSRASITYSSASEAGWQHFASCSKCWRGFVFEKARDPRRAIRAFTVVEKSR